MIDLVFPDQNEEEFIKIAERLGYGSLCFFYRELKPAYKDHIEHLQKKTGITLYTASSEIKKIMPDILVIKTTDPRQWIEGRKADLIYGMESTNERDSITQKRSGLNHVLCSLAKQKDKMICFDFSSVLLSHGQRRAVIMGRMMQNIRLCRKYKVETAMASFAHEPLDMRNPSDLKAFFLMLGMDSNVIKKSLSSIEDRIKLNIRRKNNLLVHPGMERL